MDSGPPSPFGVEDLSDAEGNPELHHSDNEINDDLFHPDEFFPPAELENPNPDPMELEEELANLLNPEPQIPNPTPSTYVASSSSSSPPTPLPSDIVFPISEDVMRQLCDNVRYLSVSKDEVSGLCNKISEEYATMAHDLAVVGKNLKDDKEHNKELATRMKELSERDQKLQDVVDAMEKKVRGLISDNHEVHEFAEKGKAIREEFEKLGNMVAVVKQMVSLQMEVTYLRNANQVLLDSRGDMQIENQAWSDMFRKLERILKKKFGVASLDDLSDDEEVFAEDSVPSSRPSA